MSRITLSLILVLSMLLACAARQPEPELEVHDVRGEVLDLLDNEIVVLKHEDIGDWMKAMTMEFPVQDPAEFAKLSKGDTIECKIYVQGMDYHLADIQVVERPAENPPAE